MQLIDTPWLAKSVKDVGEALPPALILHGSKGLGKETLSLAMVQARLCSQPKGLISPCDSCDECNLFNSGNHPDHRHITQEDVDETKTGEYANKRNIPPIGITSIRKLSEFTSTKPHRGRAKVITINPAERLNLNASNALLKILEEPPSFLHFILVCQNLELLIPTIRSRCVKTSVAPPARAVALEWLVKNTATDTNQVSTNELTLSLCGNAPLAAKELIQDAEFFKIRSEILDYLRDEQVDSFAVAKRCEKISAEWMARIFFPLIHDILLESLDFEGVMYHQDASVELKKIKQKSSNKDFLIWLDHFVSYLKTSNHPLNRLLALEALFLRWPTA